MLQDRTRALVVSFAVMLLVATACDDGGPADPTAGTDPTGPTTTTGPTTGPTGPTSAPPVQVRVPSVEGRPEARAREALEDDGFVVSVELKYSHDRAGVVLRQSPKDGRRIEAGSTVELLVSQAFPQVPNVLSKNLDQAKQTLRREGFEVRVVQQNSTIQPDGHIVSQDPVAGTEARPGRVVTLTVINNNCTPGYSPCIPRGPDVDCAGGEGDGPRYTGKVRVTGSDPYGLDSDNDGIGCE